MHKSLLCNSVCIVCVLAFKILGRDKDRCPVEGSLNEDHDTILTDTSLVPRVLEVIY